MRVTLGLHPDIPYPFSNAPEPPSPPIRGLAEPLMVVTAQLEDGRRHIAAMLRHWLGRSGLTYVQFRAIADWGLGEPSSLDKGTMARLCNAQTPRGTSIRTLLSLEAANRAIHLWQTQGEQGAWAELGPHQAWKVRAEWMDGASWLPVPPDADEGEPGQPLALRDFLDVLVGRLDLSYVPSSLLPGGKSSAAEHLSEVLNTAILAAGWSPREGIRRLLLAYPAEEEERRQRLRAVVLGDRVLTADELEVELYAVAEAIRGVRGLALGSYGPAELQAELSSYRPRTG